MSVICIRERSSLGCACTAKIEAAENGGRHVRERTWRELFEDEGMEWTSALCKLRRYGRGNRGYVA